MPQREGEVTRVLKRVAQVMGTGKYDEALRDLLHLSEKYPDAGEIRPQIAEVLLRRGESRARRGRLKEARADFQQSLRWEQRPGALVAMARAAMVEGHLEEADRLLNEALERDDRHGPTHEALGHLMMAWGDHPGAARAFEQALGLDHASPELYLAVWKAYLQVEKLDRAHELILEGAARFPAQDALLAAVGDSLVYARGESDQAPEWWARALAANPANFEANFGLAAHHASRGERGPSLEYLKRCCAVDRGRALRLWRDDLASPFRKFGDFARDPDFRRLLGETDEA
jgi:tetratricopeptide (TPR) repeat protein